MSTVYYAITDQRGHVTMCSETDQPGTNEQKISWNQEGPVGPQGPSGISSYSVQHTTATVLAGSSQQIRAFCPAGSMPLGGGFALEVNIPGVFVVENEPIFGTDNGWSVTLNNTTANNVVADVYLISAVVS